MCFQQRTDGKRTTAAGNCYFFSKIAMNYEDAQNYCQNNAFNHGTKGRLYEPRNSKQIQRVTAEGGLDLEFSDENWLTGLKRQINSDFFHYQSDGKLSIYNHWEDLTNQENCAILSRNNVLLPASCSDKSFFICEEEFPDTAEGILSQKIEEETGKKESKNH